MSRASHSKELALSAEVRSALDHLEQSSTQTHFVPGSNGQNGNGLEEGAIALAVEPAVHRFRLFNYQCDGLEPDDKIFVEVWDSPEHPVGNDVLQLGDPIIEFSNSLMDEVEAEAARYCQALPSGAEIVDWRDLSSI